MSPRRAVLLVQCEEGGGDGGGPQHTIRRLPLLVHCGTVLLMRVAWGEA
jgi:hypothetical protein